MRIIVPYTHLADETVEALEGESVEYVDVSSSDVDYWRLLSTLWRAGEDFAVVEQDIVIRPDTMDSFQLCAGEWCCAPYPYLASPRYGGLGCVRFRKHLLRALPDLMDVVAEYTDSRHTRRHWCSLDAATQFALKDRQRSVCANHPAVGHLSASPSHGCC